jgi:biotin synthase-like enzyme
MKKTWFGRCIFLSWYCEKGTCKFCFRSTIKHKISFAKNAKRSLASILTDAIIGKNLGWTIEFLTGGYGIFPFEEIVKIAKYVSEIYNQKIWVNLGALKKEELEQLKPYVEGICASIETINPNLHDNICPDKKIGPYSDMLELAKKMGFQTSITIVVGLGETKEDFTLLKEYIKKYDLDRITFYALKPVKGTPYTKSPDPEEYAWWIKQTRDNFPKIKIMAGLTPKKVDYVKDILKAGADAITKFPALKQFDSEKAQLIEKLVKESDREFVGSLTKLPDIDWDQEVEKLSLDEELKSQIKLKLKEYLKKMSSSKL